MSEGRLPKAGSALAALFFVGLFAWMLTSPFENFFGNPDDGGPLEVHFGTPLSRVVYIYWPESGVERLNVSTGMWDRFRVELFHLFGREGTIDLGEYEIRGLGPEITGRVFRREFLKGEGEETTLETGVLVPSLPAKAQKALEKGRQKVQDHWPQNFRGWPNPAIRTRAQ